MRITKEYLIAWASQQLGIQILYYTAFKTGVLFVNLVLKVFPEKYDQFKDVVAKTLVA